MSRLRLLPILAAMLLCCGAQPLDLAHYATLRNLANMQAIRKLHPQPDGSFSFIVLGDNRDGEDVYRALLGQVNDYTAAHSGAAKPLFVLHTGDMVAHGTTAEWQRYAELRDICKLPMVHVRGNHEIRAAGGASNFARFVGNTMWIFDCAGCRFVGLDNSNGHFTPDAIAVLRKYLGLPGSDGRPPLLKAPQRSFVAIHEPPYVGRWQVHALRSDAKGGRGDEFMRAVSAAKVSAVFCGHIHMHDEMTIGGVPYIISGGAGAPLYGKLGFGDAEHGFLVVHVTRARVSWEWVKANG
jgi:3',5'-cyclic AMP phosphodiesterase CpdA